MTENKRFTLRVHPKDNGVKIFDDYSDTNRRLFDVSYRDYEDAKYLRAKLESVVDLLNQMSDEIEILNRENQALKNHIDRNTVDKICVIDVLDCAKYDKFRDNTEVVDWIAEQLGVEIE